MISISVQPSSLKLFWNFRSKMCNLGNVWALHPWKYGTLLTKSGSTGDWGRGSLVSRLRVSWNMLARCWTLPRTSLGHVTRRNDGNAEVNGEQFHLSLSAAIFDLIAIMTVRLYVWRAIYSWQRQQTWHNNIALFYIRKAYYGYTRKWYDPVLAI